MIFAELFGFKDTVVNEECNSINDVAILNFLIIIYSLGTGHRIY